MFNNSSIYEFFMDNLHKIVIPEELVKIELAISRLELSALLIVDKNNNTTMGALAQNMSVPMSTATGIIDRLVKKGFLKRGSSDEDRRVVLVSLTGHGSELVQEVKKHYDTFLNRIRKLLTDEEIETVFNIIQKVIIGLQKDEAESKSKIAPVNKKIEIE